MITDNSKEKLPLFRRMIQSVCKTSFWTFDADFNLVEAYCDMPGEMLTFFNFSVEQIAGLIIHASTSTPIVLTNQLSMVWIVDFETDSLGKTSLIHLIGPVFTEPQSIESIKNKLVGTTLSDSLRANFSTIINRIPLVPLSHFLEYGIMMHCCITDEDISPSDFAYVTAPDSSLMSEDVFSNRHVRSSWDTWLSEQKLFSCIEEGDLHYKDYINQLSYRLNSNPFGNGNSLRQVKNFTIIYTALCARAAIRGGLDPDIAYDLSDRYINSIESCKTIPTVAEINAAMQDDYVKRVHRCRTESNVSPQIKKCCSYIQLHLGEQISLEQLAKYIGYSEGHLTKKFKEDTGKTIKEYIMECRINQAKHLLHTSTLPIVDICDQLGFSSQSYFGSKFRKATGMTPSEYRAGFMEFYDRPAVGDNENS